MPPSIVAHRISQLPSGLPTPEVHQQGRERSMAVPTEPISRFGTTEDGGFALFCDDMSMSRAFAFAKMDSRVLGMALAAKRLGVT